MKGLNYRLSDDQMFYFVSIGECKDSKIVIPATYKGLPVARIDDYAFDCCSNLTEIVIPDSVTNISCLAFNECTSLTNIYVDENNIAYCSIDGNLYSKDGMRLIKYAIGKKATSFTIPNVVTSISDWAFAHCGNLTNVTIGNSVTSIGDRAFWGCDSLTNVTIGNSVTSIGECAFLGCNSLTEINIPISVTNIEEAVFSGCENLTIYCKAQSQPIGWDIYWNPDDRPVYWGS